MSELNYARAVKGQSLDSAVEIEISDQAQRELSRELTNEERSKLFAKYSPNDLLDRIKKVC